MSDSLPPMIRTTLCLLLVLGVALGAVACSDDEEPRAAAEPTTIDIGTLNDQRSTESGLQVIDVRTPEEWAEGTIEGAILRPHDAIVAGEIDDIDLDRPIAVICRSGNRATTAGEALTAAGADDVRVVRPGGVGTWADAGYPTITP